jgi:hypothetical protein
MILFHTIFRRSGYSCIIRCEGKYLQDILNIAVLGESANGRDHR